MMRTTPYSLPHVTLLLACVASGIALAAKPTTAPADDAIDFILNASAPTTAPAVPTTTTTAPASPFTATADAAARKGTFTFSDGKIISGTVTTTLDKPLRIWVPADKEFVDVSFENVRSAEAQVLWERDQREYQFLTSGSDIKTYTGRTYPARETAYAFTLSDGRTITGSIVAPFDVRTADGGDKLIVLGKRDKGPVGATLNDLVYVTKLEFHH
ncbi:MAG TPA: hypothetical protein VGN72_21020 [Tepidisphaeraceae bacterium]|jgi:hypothetical protein|nr:hypothetical protein [Tepidisphaeraceae bacterium]